MYLISDKGALDKYNVISKFFQIKWPTDFYTIRSVGMDNNPMLSFMFRIDFIYFFFFKSTSINIQYSGLLDTLKMMLFTIYLKMKTHWQNEMKI